jgi:hypothetical protein
MDQQPERQPEVPLEQPEVVTQLQHQAGITQPAQQVLEEGEGGPEGGTPLTPAAPAELPAEKERPAEEAGEEEEQLSGEAAVPAAPAQISEGEEKPPEQERAEPVAVPPHFPVEVAPDTGLQPGIRAGQAQPSPGQVHEVAAEAACTEGTVPFPCYPRASTTLRDCSKPPLLPARCTHCC